MKKDVMEPVVLLDILRRIQANDFNEDFDKILATDGNFHKDDLDALRDSGLLTNKALTSLMEDVLRNLNARREEKRAKKEAVEKEKREVLTKISESVVP